MDYNDAISEARLARLWRVDPNLIYQMRAAKRLLPDGRFPGRNHFYRPQTIDLAHHGFANDRAKEMGIPPITALIEADSPYHPSFLTAEEVANRLGKSAATVSRRTIANILPAIYITDVLPRYPNSLISLYEQELDLMGLLAVRAKDAAKILCVDVQKVRKLVKEGKLEQVHIEERPTYLFISNKSLMALLATLVRGMSPEEWREFCLQHSERMLTKQQIINEHHIAHKTITPLLESGEIPCIHTTGGRERRLTLVPESAVRKIMEARSVASAELIAELFVVRETVAQEWLDNNQLRCPKHTSGPCPLPSCLPAYIESHSNLPTDGTAWCHRRLHEKQAVLNESQVIPYLRTTSKLLQGLVVEGKIAAVRLPPTKTMPGEWRFAALDVLAYMQG